MKKKLALLMAAIMTVAMVPMTAFAAATTDINAVDQVKTAVDKTFVSRVELKKDEDATDLVGNNNRFEVYLTLDNGKFATAEDADGDEYYIMDTTDNADYFTDYSDAHGVASIDVKSDKSAILTLSVVSFNKEEIILPIVAVAEDAGAGGTGAV